MKQSGKVKVVREPLPEGMTWRDVVGANGAHLCVVWFPDVAIESDVVRIGPARSLDRNSKIVLAAIWLGGAAFYSGIAIWTLRSTSGNPSALLAFLLIFWLIVSIAVSAIIMRAHRRRSLEPDVVVYNIKSKRVRLPGLGVAIDDFHPTAIREVRFGYHSRLRYEHGDVGLRLIEILNGNKKSLLLLSSGVLPTKRIAMALGVHDVERIRVPRRHWLEEQDLLTGKLFDFHHMRSIEGSEPAEQSVVG